MYLRTLNIHGFKSFAAATELRFDSGITAIVGPNGVGKSNIVDALRWVIGEQRVRILRSDRMNSIIFNGSATKRPLGMAEVELTIENSRQVLPVEYTVITIGRRLFRSGEAEYLLNGTPCRLRDIQDMFTDTGMGAGAYSVIELKMIDEILSDKAEDRRRLFEEAAGLTKYKQRRSQAIRKLEITQTDLARVFDLTDEISRRVKSLKRQAATAARYRRYQERVQALDITLLRLERDGLESDKAATDSDLERSEDELTRWISRTSMDEAAVESLRSALIAAEHAAEANLKALHENQTQVTRIEATLTLDLEKQSVIHRDLTRLEEEHGKDQRQANDLAEEAKGLRSALNDATEVAAAADTALAHAEKEVKTARQKQLAHQDASGQQRSQLQQHADALSQHRRKLDRCDSRLAWLAEERSRLRKETQSTEVKLDDTKHDLVKASVLCSDFEEAVQLADRELKAARSMHTECSRSVGDVVQKLNAVNREAAGRSAEISMLESLIKSREDFPDAVRFLEEQGAENPLRTVSDVITCAPEHRSMLAAAVGEYGACIIVPSREAAHQVIRTLKVNVQGRVLLVMLDHVGRRPVRHQPPELSCQPIRDLVEVKSADCLPLIDLLLQDVYCVDTLQHAESLRDQRPSQAARYVTPAGDWLDDYGFLHGGGEATAAVEAHLQRRDTLEQSRDELGGLNATKTQLDRDRAELQQKLDNLDVAGFAAALHAAEIDSQSAQHKLRRLGDEHTRWEQQLGQMREQLSRVRDETAARETDRHKLKRLLEGAKTDYASARSSVKEANELQAQLQLQVMDAQDEYAARSVEAVDSKAKCEALQRSIERIRNSLAELDRKQAHRERESLLLEVRRATLAQEIEELTVSLESTRGLRSGLEEKVRGDKEQMMGLRVELKGLEDRLRKLRRECEAAQKLVTDYQMQQVAVQTRLTEVIRRVEELGDSQSVTEEDLTQEDMQAEKAALHRKMQGMGQVNALALEEYEREKKRLEFITGQCTDLQEAETTLNRTIAEINLAATRRFLDVFGTIRKNFKELFEELFGVGATCDLVLPNAEDVLESPIEIMAKPRGKRPVGITQLSSGEKTLTAIALLFAIYMVKPSPFCFLDEVDAPLDDANIDRYMRLIRRFSGETQFVLVTHNKRTMEMADRLYGITMQEQGISSMVGVQFDQALAFANS